MKRNLYHFNKQLAMLYPAKRGLIATIILLCLITFTANAQLDSCNIFLRGNYVEVGSNQTGAYGSSISAPVTYVSRAPSFGFYNPCDSGSTTRSRSNLVGYISDPDKDGWYVGTPAYYGDYFLPGDPQEGWGIEVNGTEADAYTPNLSSGTTGFSGSGASFLSGSNVSWANDGITQTGIWTGYYNSLQLTQTTTADTGALYFLIYTVFKNTGATTLNNIYYMRTVDPDNDEQLSGDYTTRNVVSYKIPNAQNKVLVSSWGTHYAKAYCGLGTEDCRAKAFIVTCGLVPCSKIDQIYNQTGSSENYDSLTSDVGIGLSYKLGNLAPGDSTAVTYAYILGINDLDSAFAATKPRWVYSGDSAKLTTGDTAIVCKNSVSTVAVLNAGAYSWTWSATPSSTSISPTTGNTVNVTVGTSPVTVRAIGISAACFTDTIYMYLSPTKTPGAPSPVTTTYCQYDIPKKLSASGINLLWYTTATGGVGSSVAPTPSTAVPGTYHWWVTQTIRGCESDRTMITVIVNAGSVDSFTYAIHYGCNGDTVVLTNYTVGSVAATIWDFGDSKTDTTLNPYHIYTATGSYLIKLLTQNAVGCKYSYSKTVTLTHPLSSSFTVTPDTTCEFKPLNFVSSSTALAPSYTWIFGDGSTATGSTATHSYNLTGTYNVMLITGDFRPCYDTAYHKVTIDTFAIVNFVPSDTLICQGKSILFNGAYSTIGNTGAVWDFGDGTKLYNTEITQHAYDAPGTYTVSLTAKYRQCPDTAISKTINVTPIPVVNLGPDTAICPNSGSILLQDNINAANSNATWLWSTGETTSSIQVSKMGIYYATVTILGCSNSDSVEIRNDCYINIPNSFTPNGDGLNDYFLPRQLLSSGLISFKMDIYDRWGELIYETSNIEGRGWDGKFNDKPQPTGVYVYVIDLKIKNGVTQHYQGNVTLLR